jgi:hypothetical protein
MGKSSKKGEEKKSMERWCSITMGSLVREFNELSSAVEYDACAYHDGLL